MTTEEKWGISAMFGSIVGLLFLIMLKLNDIYELLEKAVPK